MTGTAVEMCDYLRHSLVPGRERTEMKTAKPKQMRWVNTTDAVLVKP